MTTFSSAGYALATGDGQHIWFLGTAPFHAIRARSAS
jgi:hypothetical protein